MMLVIPYYILDKETKNRYCVEMARGSCLNFYLKDFKMVRIAGIAV